MQTRAKFGAIPRAAIILVTVGILAALLTAVAIGAQPNTTSELAPLFGLAGNGRIFSSHDDDIYVTDAVINVPQPFDVTYSSDRYPTMTNDGSHVLFQRDDGTTYQILIAASDGSDHPRALTPSTFASLVDWWPSPDGSTVAVVGPSGATQDIHLIPTDGSMERSLPVGMSLTGAIWEPDARHLLATHVPTDKKGAELYRVPVDGGDPTLVRYLSGGVKWLNISPDGKHIAYTSSPDALGGTARPPQAWVANIDGSDAHRLTDSTDAWEDGAFWSPDSSHLAMTTWAGDSLRVTILDAATGAQLAVSDPMSVSGSMTISDDVRTATTVQRPGRRMVGRSSCGVRPIPCCCPSIRRPVP